MCGTGSQSKDGAGTEQRGKKREEEVKAQFRGMSEEPVFHDRGPSSPCDRRGGSVMPAPKGMKGRAGHKFPDTPLSASTSPINAGIFARDDAPEIDLSG